MYLVNCVHVLCATCKFFAQGGAEERGVEVNQSWVALAKGAFCQILNCKQNPVHNSVGTSEGEFYNLMIQNLQQFTELQTMYYKQKKEQK